MIRVRSATYLDVTLDDGTDEATWSGTTGRDAQPVAVWIYEGGFASGKPCFIDGNAKLPRYAIDVLDVEVDQRVWARVARVF